jgi:hypothetical protein
LALERRPFRVPNPNVVVNVRIKGDVSPESLQTAVRRVRQRHRLLDVRVVLDRAGEAWFDAEGAQDIAVKVFPRRSDGHWIEKSLEEYRIPHELDRRPPIRFVLLRAPEVSDLIIMCHHMMCDAMSLALVARDVLRQLGDPARECEVLPDPPLANRENIPAHVSSSVLARLSTNRLNSKWKQDEVLFDGEDFRNIFDAYWRHNTPRAIPLEFTEEQTSCLVARCREEGVTVNTALLAALLAAQCAVQGNRLRYLRRTATAMNVRRHLIRDPGEAFGFYAGGVILDFKVSPGRPFWNVARALHRRLGKEFKPRDVLARILAFNRVAPTMYDGLMFKRFGNLVQPGQSRYEKLAAFCARRDALSSTVRAREREPVRVGVVLSNLTCLPIARQHGRLELDRIMFLGAGSRSYQKGVGVATVSGKLTMMVSYIEESVDGATMAAFRTSLLDVLARGVEW